MGFFYSFEFVVERSSITPKLIDKLIDTLWDLNNSPPDDALRAKIRRELLKKGSIDPYKDLAGPMSHNTKDRGSCNLYISFTGVPHFARKYLPKGCLIFEISIIHREYYHNERRRARFVKEAKAAYNILHPKYGAGDTEYVLDVYEKEKHPWGLVHRYLFFGPELVEEIGREKLLSTPAKVEKLEDGGIFIRVPRVKKLDVERRVEKVRAVATHLRMKFSWTDLLKMRDAAEPLRVDVTEDYRK